MNSKFFYFQPKLLGKIIKCNMYMPLTVFVFVFGTQTGIQRVHVIRFLQPIYVGNLLSSSNEIIFENILVKVILR